MSKPVHPAQQFADDINNGVIQTDRDITVLCCTHNEDLRLQKESYFPFEFDEAVAIVYVDALLKPLLRPKASPAEQFFIWRAFGWVTKATGARRYATEAF